MKCNIKVLHTSFTRRRFLASTSSGKSKNHFRYLKNILLYYIEQCEKIWLTKTEKYTNKCQNKTLDKRVEHSESNFSNFIVDRPNASINM